MTSERIVDSRTKSYFKEVIGSYNAGHYRSSVVMLWSVIICDILFKLDQLAKAYNDEKAENILLEVNQIRSQNVHSADWEIKLVRLVEEKTYFLDKADLSYLETIQKHRHLSAHPVLDENNTLFSPNHETARAHIRNALESVLTKPAIMSKKVFDTFIEDIEGFSHLNLKREELKRMLRVKYFSHFASETKKEFFKSLWRIVFKSLNERCERNREVNFEVLSIIMDDHRHEIKSIIQKDREWFSDISYSDDHLWYLTSFLSEFTDIYVLLTDAAKTPIEKYAKASFDNYLLCWFLSDSAEDHVKDIYDKILNDSSISISSRYFQFFANEFVGSPLENYVINIGILLYIRSESFNEADVRFNRMISPFLEKYTQEHFENLMSGIEQNDQTWGRGRAFGDHPNIKKVICEKFPDFSFDRFYNFNRSCR